MPALAPQDACEDIEGVVDELNDEYGKLMDTVAAICNQLRNKPDKALLSNLLAHFNTSWVEDSLDDLASAIGNVKDTFNLD